MPIRTLLTTGLLAALMALPLGAAEDGHHHKRHAEGDHHAKRDHGDHCKAKARVRRAALVKRFDQDGDGELSDAEKAAAKAAWKEHRGDKKGERREKLLAKFDQDGDGSLSEAEKAAARQAVQQHVQQRIAKLKSEHPELYAKFDQDGDGSLSREELARAKKLRKHHKRCHDGKRRHGDRGVRDHGKGEGRDGAGEGKGREAANLLGE